ncbi:hypothetical protein [Psychrobacillus sp. NPDC093200]|uniref:hypothetical protein n=1 Tax=Psychrobacillus sp. NPDC093200 TaxID=3390656 RepID=UPI003CFDEEF7
MDIYYDSGQRIKVTFIDDQVLIGIVDHWTPPGDSDDGIQELSIVPTEGKLKGRLVNFNENEIKSIELIE